MEMQIKLLAYNCHIILVLIVLPPRELRFFLLEDKQPILTFLVYQDQWRHSKNPNILAWMETKLNSSFINLHIISLGMRIWLSTHPPV